ncbi:NAD(P)/FAD-dependent oxidoreductase [Epilithonimonas sp.]|uniref:NAD(P)/FAD-dependent oxidoreductase n=1 Tax=Epilithonimonas sp. TaxID=2894511 RepID=UPI00289C9121|nr:NAD(P)/FAD-dependent oxidoreductase [Epilithonimonas sp.]
MLKKKSVIIIGGGAAGFFTAANLDENKFYVTILEQNSDVLQKVKISGGGRCNVTHACFDPRELVNFYPRGNRELLSVFTKFQPGDTMDWFESRNVPLKIEKDNRVFPTTDSSQSIINILINEVRNKGFEIRNQVSVSEIIKEDDIYFINTKSESYTADVVVYTTGSSPKSLKIIGNLGHKIIEPVPSLFTFNIKDDLLKDLPGTSFANAEIKIPSLKTEDAGPLLITHWGLSGPAVLKLSAWEARTLAKLKYKFDIEVNFISKSISEAEELLKNFKNENPKKSVGQAKIFDITNRFWNKILEVNKIDPEKQMANLSKKEMDQIFEYICQKRFAVTGKSTFKDEFVTAGGVDLKEINFKNMSSKILSDFYISGEVLDIDAVTGGFNFQACWSEAWLIAQHLNIR